MKIILSPLLILEFLIVFGIFFTIGAAVGCIVTPFYVLFSLFLVLRLTWRWGLSGQKKSIKKTEAQKKKIEARFMSKENQSKIGNNKRNHYESIEDSISPLLEDSLRRDLDLDMAKAIERSIKDIRKSRGSSSRRSSQTIAKQIDDLKVIEQDSD